jgi:hypothetical protein
MGALLTSIFGWMFRTVLIKFILFSALFLVVSEFASYLTTKISILTPDTLNASLSAFTPTMWYFVDLTMLQVGFPMVVSAYLLRFAIRRIPFLG